MWLALIVAFFASSCRASGWSHVERRGAQLFLDGKPFRAAGGNIYWAGLDENREWSNGTAHVAYPTDFCVQDAFATAKRMGATVVRCHTCGISLGNPLSFETALGVFNSTATDHIDIAVAAARANGIRLIVPLMDNWHYYHGGKHVITDWLGLPSEDDFFTNAKAVAAFKEYVGMLLNHTSSISGVRYGDDATVMIWETGNELHYKGGPPPTAWTADIAQYIKGLSPNHLVMDGTDGVNPPALAIPEIDVVSLHMYPGPSAAVAAVEAAVAVAGGKAFVAGEFGWKTDSLQPFLEMVDDNDNVSADLYWSLFPHANDHGFVPHGDSYTLHFPDGDGHPEAVAALRTHAWEMQGQSPPPAYLPPAQPELTLVSDGAGIAWRGSAGSGNYTVQASRAGGQEASWVTVCDKCANDTSDPIPMPAGWSQSDSFRVAGVSVDGASLGPWSATWHQAAV